MPSQGTNASQEEQIPPTGSTALLSQAQRDATYRKQRNLDMKIAAVKAVRRGMSVMDA